MTLILMVLVIVFASVDREAAAAARARWRTFNRTCQISAACLILCLLLGSV